MRRAVLMLLALAATPTAEAHELELTTARVTLRDGHAEVLVDLDLTPLLVHLCAGAPDATALATLPEPALEACVTAARTTLAAQAHLEVDGVDVPLALRAFPSTAEARALAAFTSSGAPVSDRRARLALETTRPLVDPRAIGVALPTALGPVLFSFVQPTARLTPAGTKAAFQVLGARPPSPPRGEGRGAALALAAALAGVLLVQAWRARRGASRTGAPT